MNLTARNAISPQHRRRGAISLAVLIFGSLVVLLALAYLQRLCFRLHHQLELQVAADAAAHAGAADLANDLLLMERPENRLQLLMGCRQTARRYGELNRAHGGPVTIADNPENAESGEVIFHSLDLQRPKGQAIVESPTDTASIRPLNLLAPDLNALRVTLRRDNIVVSAMAVADRDVVGFRAAPAPPITPERPREIAPPTLPLVPLALFSRLCPPGQFGPECWEAKADGSWEHRILARRGDDRWRFDPATQTVSEGSDGIPEIEVILSEGASAADNAQPVRFTSVANPAALVRQARTGVTFEDLRERNGTLLLNTGTQPRNVLGLFRQPLDAKMIASLGAQLAGLVGQPRIWMLYSEVQAEEETAENTVVVVGFVAARLMAVVSQTENVAGTERLVMTLQPTVLNVSEAVTNSRLRDLGPRPIYNPYLARVRVVE